MTHHTHDYFRVVDLNPPAAPGPITDPRDPRGQCYFGFTSEGQRLVLDFGTTPPPLGTRIFYTFDHDYFTGVGMPPPPSTARIHGTLSFGSSTPPEERYVELHDRPFVAIWVDPTTPPPTGVTIQVQVKAWRKD